MSFLDRFIPSPSKEALFERVVGEPTEIPSGVRVVLEVMPEAHKAWVRNQYPGCTLEPPEGHEDTGRVLYLTVTGEQAKQFMKDYAAHKEDKRCNSFTALIAEMLTPAFSDAQFYDLVHKVEPTGETGEQKVTVTLTSKGWLRDAFDRKFPEAKFAENAEILEPEEGSPEPVKARIMLEGEDAERFVKEYAAHLARSEALLCGTRQSASRG